MEQLEFSILKGKTLKSVEVDRKKEQITFIDTEDNTYCLWHAQDCSESVFIEDIVGDINNLIKTPIVMAELVVDTTKELPPSDRIEDESYTWSFYKLATIKGYVTIRWFGTSNGYYSEEVDFTPF